MSIPLCNPHRRRSAATGEFESGEGSIGMLTITIMHMELSSQEYKDLMDLWVQVFSFLF